MHIDIHALGRQGDGGNGCALAVDLCSSSLRPVLRVHRGLGHADHCLLFLVAGGHGHDKQQGHAEKSSES